VRAALAGLCGLLLFVAPGVDGLHTPLHAQEESGAAGTGEGVSALSDGPFHPEATPVPFGIGEKLTYEVKMGAFGVGDGALEVAGVDTVRGRPSYHVTMRLDGSFLFASVHDFFQSWFDVRSLVSRRLHKKIHEVNYKDDREYEIYPEERRWERSDEEKGGEMLSSFPLDDLAFLYFVRTLDLEPGREYRFDRYFKEEGNPVVVRVTGRDTVEVPAGKFPTVVVRPTFRTEGMFREGGEAELHFTDDEEHHLVYMRVKIPVMRSLTLHLESIEEGQPLWRSTGSAWEGGQWEWEEPGPDDSGDPGEPPGGR